jgi:hypothetical protein
LGVEGDESEGEVSELSLSEFLDREQGPRYAAELDKACEILGHAHPVGEVKAIGRLEVASALGDLFPPDSHAPITPEWLRSIGFREERNGCGLVLFDKANPDAGHVNYWCRPEDGAHTGWSIQEESVTDCLSPITRGELRMLCRLANVQLKEKR